MFPAADLWLFLTPFLNLLFMKQQLPLASLSKPHKLADCYADSVSNNTDSKRNAAFYPEIVASDVLQSALIKTWRVRGLFPTSLTESTRDARRLSSGLRLQTTTNWKHWKGQDWSTSHSTSPALKITGTTVLS